MIVGGEKFMWTAYAVTWGGMVGYFLSLLRRRKAVDEEHAVFVNKVGKAGLSRSSGLGEPQ